MSSGQKKARESARVSRRNSLFLAFWLLLAAAGSHQLTPQVFADGGKAFDGEGLSFSYPADWALTDKGDSQQQYLALTRNDAAMVIAVIASRGQVSTFEQFAVIRRKVSEPLIRSLASLFGTPG